MNMTQACADGTVTRAEWIAAEELMQHGELTEEEFETIDNAYLNGCPGLIDIPGEEYDACEGVVCAGTECVGTDLYSQVCEDGRCVRGIVFESNSPACGYLAPARGIIKTVTWEACHDRGGCSTTKAYWGSTVTVSTSIQNVGKSRGGFKIKIVNVNNTLDILAHGFFRVIDPNQTLVYESTFIMPSAPLLQLNVELIRDD